MNRLRRLVVLAVLIWLLSLTALSSAAAAPARQGDADWAIPNGHFYTQTAPAGSGLGFRVMDDGQARFWSEFNRLGGLQTVGYPISRRFVYDGFVTQAFQKLVLQWRPEVNQAWPVNVFDELSYAGLDEVLLMTRQTPRQFPPGGFDAPGATWPQIVAARQGLLNQNPAIRARYFSTADALNVFGLPTSRVEDMGNHYAIRTQRAVFQQWKEQVPWAAAGQVTIANGGDIAKEFGWLRGETLLPESPEGSGATAIWEISTLLVGPGTPGRLYALQYNTLSPREYRLLVSDDAGGTWRPFPGALPVGPDCLHNVNMDYATVDALYASTCEGIFRWSGSQWSRVSTQAARMVAITYGNPQKIWAVGLGQQGNAILYSDNGGQSWNDAGATRYESIDLAISPRDPNLIYALWGYRSWWYTLYRGGGNGTWTPLRMPLVTNPTVSGMALDGATGDVYLSAFAPSASNSINVDQIWKSANPDALDASTVSWQLVHDFGPRTHARLLATGQSASGGLALYAALRGSPSEVSTLHRSLDGGATWQPMAIR